MGKKIMKLTESDLIKLIKEAISDIEMETEMDSQKTPKIREKMSFTEFMSLTRDHIGGNFENRYKIENGKFYVRVPMRNQFLRMPFAKEWIEIIND